MRELIEDVELHAKIQTMQSMIPSTSILVTKQPEPDTPAQQPMLGRSPQRITQKNIEPRNNINTSA